MSPILPGIRILGQGSGGNLPTFGAVIAQLTCIARLFAFNVY